MKLAYLPVLAGIVLAGPALAQVGSPQRQVVAATRAATIQPVTAGFVGGAQVYPQDELLALRRRTEAAQAAAPVASGLSVEQLHFNYAINQARASAGRAAK